MNDIKDLCFKYLGGTSEVEEERVVLTFIKESEGNRLLFEEWKSDLGLLIVPCPYYTVFRHLNLSIDGKHSQSSYQKHCSGCSCRA